MRAWKILLVRLAFSAFVTASLMAAVVITIPALRAAPRLGFGLVVGTYAVCFTLLTVIRPRGPR